MLSRQMQKQLGPLVFGHSARGRNEVAAAALGKDWDQNVLCALTCVQSEPVRAKNEILVEVSQNVSRVARLCMGFGGKGKEVAGWKKAGSVLSGLSAQWHMDNHFVPVKISCEALASQWTQLDHLTRIRRQWNRMKCLEAVAVQGRLAVQQHHEIRMRLQVRLDGGACIPQCVWILCWAKP